MKLYVMNKDYKPKQKTSKFEYNQTDSSSYMKDSSNLVAYTIDIDITKIKEKVF